MEGAAGIQFPDEARTHPMPRANAHSPATPQAVHCLGARNDLDVLRHPDTAAAPLLSASKRPRHSTDRPKTQLESAKRRHMDMP